MKQIALVVVSALSSMLVFAAADHPQPSIGRRLVLTVQKPEDKTREIIPGSKWYVADLANNGDEILRLQAIQMPGGYAGLGKFFPCGLQVWNSRRHEWVRLWVSEVGPSPHFVDVELKPRDHKQVCNMLLPSQAGSVGQCVRFKFRTRWQPTSSFTLFSKPFEIGDVPAKDGPCRGTR